MITQHNSIFIVDVFFNRRKKQCKVKWGTLSLYTHSYTDVGTDELESWNRWKCRILRRLTCLLRNTKVVGLILSSGVSSWSCFIKGFDNVRLNHIGWMKMHCVMPLYSIMWKHFAYVNALRSLETMETAFCPNV